MSPDEQVGVAGAGGDRGRGLGVKARTRSRSPALVVTLAHGVCAPFKVGRSVIWMMADASTDVNASRSVEAEAAQ